MRKKCAALLAVCVAALGMPTGVLAAGAQGATGGVQGVAKNAAQQNLSGVKVQVRGPNGQLAASGTTDASGSFSFAGLNPGLYTVEVLDAAGNIVGTSAAIGVTAGTMATVTVSAAAAGALAAAAGGGMGLFGLGTIATVAVVGAAGAATIAAIVVTRNDASPSQ